MIRFRRKVHRRSLGGVSLVCALLASASCTPPAEAEAPVQEPEPVQDGAIPWAPGEAPVSAEETTREVEPAPEPQEAPPPSHFEEDGIHETGAARCTGKAPPALRSLVDVRAQETSVCSRKIPEDQAGASGDLKISLKVAKTGEVKAVELLSDTLKVPEVSSCVQEILKKPFVEAKPRGGCALFVLPLHFESEKADPADQPSE